MADLVAAQDDGSVEIDLYDPRSEERTAVFSGGPAVCTMLDGFCRWPGCVVCGPIYERWEAVAAWRGGTAADLEEETDVALAKIMLAEASP